jgi:hypothetical protein
LAVSVKHRLVASMKALAWRATFARPNPISEWKAPAQALQVDAYRLAV